MRYVFYTKITEVFERKLKKHVSGVGDNAVFETASAGWYLQFGFTTVYVGMQEPTDVKVGQRIKLILESDDAKP